MTILSLLTLIDGGHRIKFTGILAQQLVAFCELDLDQPQAHVTTLFSVYVDPAHRHQGYARSLVLAAIEAAQAHGKDAVNMRVQEANEAAVKLYRQAGFEQYGGPDEEGFLEMVRWV